LGEKLETESGQEELGRDREKCTNERGRMGASKSDGGEWFKETGTFSPGHDLCDEKRTGVNYATRKEGFRL